MWLKLTHAAFLLCDISQSTLLTKLSSWQRYMCSPLLASHIQVSFHGIGRMGRVHIELCFYWSLLVSFSSFKHFFSFLNTNNHNVIVDPKGSKLFIVYINVSFFPIMPSEDLFKSCCEMLWEDCVTFLDPWIFIGWINCIKLVKQSSIIFCNSQVYCLLTPSF